MRARPAELEQPAIVRSNAAEPQAITRLVSTPRARSLRSQGTHALGEHKVHDARVWVDLQRKHVSAPYTQHDSSEGRRMRSAHRVRRPLHSDNMLLQVVRILDSSGSPEEIEPVAVELQ